MALRYHVREKPSDLGRVEVKYAFAGDVYSDVSGAIHDAPIGDIGSDRFAQVVEEAKGLVRKKCEELRAEREVLIHAARSTQKALNAQAGIRTRLKHLMSRTDLASPEWQRVYHSIAEMFPVYEESQRVADEAQTAVEDKEARAFLEKVGRPALEVTEEYEDAVDETVVERALELPGERGMR